MYGAIVVSRDDIEEQNVVKLMERLEAYRKEFKRITGYQWDNNHALYTNYFGKKFAIHIIESSIAVWDDSGKTGLLTVEINGDVVTCEVMDEIEKVTRQWMNGIIHCSACRKEIIYLKHNKNRYFAGVYCNKCWNDKYKAIEAAENYE